MNDLQLRFDTTQNKLVDDLRVVMGRAQPTRPESGVQDPAVGGLQDSNIRTGERSGLGRDAGGRGSRPGGL